MGETVNNADFTGTRGVIWNGDFDARSSVAFVTPQCCIVDGGGFRATNQTDEFGSEVIEFNIPNSCCPRTAG